VKGVAGGGTKEVERGCGNRAAIHCYERLIAIKALIIQRGFLYNIRVPLWYILNNN
jgi:hypothetical protein